MNPKPNEVTFDDVQVGDFVSCIIYQDLWKPIEGRMQRSCRAFAVNGMVTVKRPDCFNVKDEHDGLPVVFEKDEPVRIFR